MQLSNNTLTGFSAFEAPISTIEITVSTHDHHWSSFPEAEEIVTKSARAATAIVTGGQQDPIEMSVALMSDAEIKALNAQFCQKDKPTNVLSFPNGMMLAGGETIFLGDIAIAYETLLAEARAENKLPEHHLAHLVVHGVLHLFGYDHDSEDEAERMEVLECRILSYLGVPDPYATYQMLEPEAA